MTGWDDRVIGSTRSPFDANGGDHGWLRFLNYMEREVRPNCKPQRETLAGGPFAWLQTHSEWDGVLSKHRMVFDPSGWHGTHLREAMSGLP